jgi:hypothetical protein
MLGFYTPSKEVRDRFQQLWATRQILLIFLRGGRIWIDLTTGPQSAEATVSGISEGGVADREAPHVGTDARQTGAR